MNWAIFLWMKRHCVDLSLINDLSRPSAVCWCPFLPATRLKIHCRLVVLQHPAEERRCLRTVPMLMQSLEAGSCVIFKGKKFPSNSQELHRSGSLYEILSSQDSVLLYPSRDAKDITEVVGEGRQRPQHLIVIDGTWDQARSIYHNSPMLKSLKQVKLSLGSASEYVIRTQPSEGCLSTLEAAAQALSILEDQPSMRQELLAPLHALCSFQLLHGAVSHQSKQFLVELDAYAKPVGKRTRKLLRQSACELRLNKDFVAPHTEYLDIDSR
ncbi:tRNA-uridine aminocarboxypropyltransferase 2 isoform X3 [Ischnura elegans]|uniref:tRNA-uridine aminocarboxypropyltransferase 2 isoform X3 n=1 Tax=Ischnura elegans TaxID=197161 RepID=UPI001ED87B8A|nr:tRNA-uridine aminocarboxypropyltransferase 2 isoform X3 [Ischnura elegans]XP_046402616.1 tRNA-uridine aminocarboxypropyltransferase 2 isoform X3 [Ischnura elegans]